MIPERVHLGIADARALSERAMRGIGYEPEEARILADHVIDAALCGDEYSGLPKRIVHTRTGDPAPTHPMADSPAVLPLSACRLLPRLKGGSAMTATLSLKPLGPALGTEVVGADLSRRLDDATLEWIERAFAEHPVLVFRGQRLGAAELAAFGAQFGRPQPHILEQYRHPDHPDVSYITNVDKAGGVDRFGVVRASSWHTDETYEDALPRLAILHAIEMPSAKGGTIFADMRAAYDALPEATRRRLEPLVGLHGRTDGPDAVKVYGADYTRSSAKARPERRHPAVKTHPVSGRRILFVNPTHTHGFDGMAEPEAVRLIEELRDHATQAPFVYYHAWRVGDVVMWDELATMHRSAGDARPEERRIMLRTIVHPS